ncbi:hypothetical protein EMPS_00507 [Entomortierella parvispora]|uniref:Uncharacterized protein n=1 Tax=Entomortierella parvispora TaxID=205924 RepID=A0A9P3H149_9FUNG|nr:hypothetical protein EMPS_00507 [Entomortierella parvispora]
MIRKAAYQSVVVVDPAVSKQISALLQQQQQSPSLLPTAVPPQKIVHKVPIYLVQRTRSVLVKDLEKILGPGRRLESVQADDGTILLPPPQSIVASSTFASRPTVIPVRDGGAGRTKYRNGQDEGEEEKEDVWFIHPIVAPATGACVSPTPPSPSLPLIESQADKAATVATTTGSLIPSHPCSRSGSCSSSSSTSQSSLPQQQEKTEQGEKTRGELNFHDQQASKDQARAEPPIPTQMTTRSSTFSEQQQKDQFEPKVEHQTRSFRATMATSGQSLGDPWTRSRIKRSTLQHEDKEDDALDAVAAVPRRSIGERGSGKGNDNDEHDKVQAVEKRTDVNGSKDSSVQAPLFSSSPSSLSFPPSSASIPTFPSQPTMASTSTSASALPLSPSSLSPSTSTDTILMRQQLLQMANALVSIADRGDDIAQDRGHARTLALQVLESYTHALAGSTSPPSSSDKVDSGPPPSSSVGMDTRHGMITPDATPQSTPVIPSSYRLSSPNTDTRSSNDTMISSPSSTPFSSPSSSALPLESPTLMAHQIHCPPSLPDVGSADFCTSLRSSIFSLPPSSLQGQEQCAQPDPNIEQHSSSSSSSPSASQSFTALDQPTSTLPTTIPEARKGSKKGNKTGLARILRSKSSFGAMFGSNKSRSLMTTPESEESTDVFDQSLQETMSNSARKGSADSSDGSSQRGSSNNSHSDDSQRSGSNSHEEVMSTASTPASTPTSTPASSNTPWYKIQQRRRESRASSVSESGSGSNSNNGNNSNSSSSSGTTTSTKADNAGRELGSRRFSSPFGFRAKPVSTTETRQRASVSHIQSQPQPQPQQQQQEQQQYPHHPSHQHHTQHTQHTQQHQQPPSYSSSTPTLQKQVQLQRHLYSADARIGGRRSVTRTATGSFFDTVSDSDSDEEIAHPTYLQQQCQYQPQYQQMQGQERTVRRMTYPTASTSVGPTVLPTSSSRFIQSDPRTQERLRQQEEQQEQSHPRYQVYDSDESDSEDEDDSEFDEDEDDDDDEEEDEEEEEEECLQRSQRQPYAPTRVLVDPESLEGYVHQFDEAPPPSYHSLVRSGSVSVSPLASLSQLLELLHHFKDHVLDTFKTPDFRIKGMPSSSATASPSTTESTSLTSDRHHTRRESWQSRRPQTVASFAYLLIELEQNGLVFPANATLFLISAASSSASLFCRSEQDWLAKTGNATTVSQLAMALLTLEQTCQDQAMMDLNRWRSSSSSAGTFSPCARDQWIVQVQGLSTVV